MHTQKTALMSIAIVLAAIPNCAHCQILPDALVQALQKAEDRLHNIKIDGTHTAEEWNAEKNKWELVATGDITAWYIGRPGSKARIDLRTKAVRWTGGIAPYGSSVESFAYNGRVGQQLVRSAGGQGKAIGINRGLIQSQRPSTLDGCASASGWQFSINGFKETRGKSLSEVVQKWIADKRTSVSLDSRTYRDANCLCIRATHVIDQKTAEEMVYLDPSRNYSLLAYEEHNNGKLITKCVVEEIAEVAPGVFFPKKARAENDMNHDGQPENRLVWNAIAVVANDSGFTDDVFLLDWPAGTYVQNNVHGGGFTIGLSDAEIVPKINEIVTEALSAVTSAPGATVDSQPSAKKAGPGESGMAGTPRSETATAREEGAWWILGVLAAALIAAVAIWVWRRRNAGCTMLLCVIVTTSYVNAQTRIVGLREMPKENVYNCGLLATATVLARFERKIDVKALEIGLGTSPQQERPTSMADMKDYLQKQALSAEAYKGATLEEAIRLLNGGNVVVLHTQQAGGPGHYYVLAGYSSCGVYLINPGLWGRWVDPKKMTMLLADAFTGYCMTIRDPGKDQIVYDIGRQEIVKVEVGVQHAGPGDLLVIVPVTNGGREEISIVRWWGTCGCIRSVSLDAGGGRRLSAKASGELRIVFNRGVLGTGRIARSAVIKLNGAAHAVLKVEVTGTIDADEDRTIRWLPERIDFGIVSDPNTFMQPQCLSIIAPSDVTITSIPSDAGIVVEQDGAPVAMSNSKRLVHEYMIRIVQHQDGATLDKKATFRTSLKGMPTIVVPLIGRVHAVNATEQAQKMSAGVR